MIVASLPKTWIGWLNFIVLQWFTIRLCYSPKTRKVVGFAYFVFPLSGWWSDFYPEQIKIKRLR